MTPIFLILNYNNDRYIADFLASLKIQDLDGWKIFIVDDKSTDDSIEIIKDEISKHNLTITVIQNSVNLGINQSIKTFLENQEIEDENYIKLMASDDILSLGALDVTRAAMSTNADMYYSDIYEIDDENNIIRYGKTISEHDFKIYKELYLINNYFPATSTTIKAKYLKSAIDNIENVFNAEDWPLLIDVVRSNARIEKISYPVTYYRRHNHSLSASYFDKNIKANSKIYSDVYQILKHNENIAPNYFIKLLVQLRRKLHRKPQNYLKLIFLMHKEYRRYKGLTFGNFCNTLLRKIKNGCRNILLKFGYRRRINYIQLYDTYGKYCVNDLSGNYDKKVYNSILHSQLKKYNEFLSQHKFTGSALDYGCGTGKFTTLLRRHTFTNISCFDTSHFLLQVCEDCDELVNDASKLGSYDFILLHNVMGGIPKHYFETVIKHLDTAAKDGAYLMIVDVCSQENYGKNLTWAPVNFQALFERLGVHEISRDYIFEHGNKLRISLVQKVHEIP